MLFLILVKINKITIIEVIEEDFTSNIPRQVTEFKVRYFTFINSILF